LARYIDHVSITYCAKKEKEISDAAHFVALYSIDYGSTFDSGSNLLHDSANEQTIVAGRVSNALQFNSSTDYFQSFGFTALGDSNQLFTISLWVTLLIRTGTLVHLSNQSTDNG
jgi:hypothetical protein